MGWSDFRQNEICFVDCRFWGVIFADAYIAINNSSVGLSDGQFHRFLIVFIAMHLKLCVLHSLASFWRHYTTNQGSRERPAFMRGCCMVQATPGRVALRRERRSRFDSDTPRQSALFRNSGALQVIRPMAAGKDRHHGRLAERPIAPVC